MRSTNLVLKMTVTANDVAEILTLRRAYDAQKKRLEMIETELAKLELDIIGRIHDGAAVLCNSEVTVKSIERRNVPWKSVTAELIGHEATESILQNTKPTVSYRLLIGKVA